MQSVCGYESYIFDVDGTIFDAAPGILSALRAAIERCGIPVPVGKLNQSLIGPKLPEMIDSLGVADSVDVKSKIIAAFRDIYDSNLGAGVVLYPAARKVLADCADKTLFVATNKPFAVVKKLFEIFGLNSFKDVYCPDKYSGIVLTKADMLREISEKYGYAPSDMLMIGDTMGDFKAARECGCDFAFATWGYEKDKKAIARQAEIVLE